MAASAILKKNNNITAMDGPISTKFVTVLSAYPADYLRKYLTDLNRIFGFDRNVSGDD